MFKIGDKVQFIPGQTIRHTPPNEVRAKECGLEMDAAYEIERIHFEAGCVIIRGHALDMRRLKPAGGPW